ncbi:mucin-5AC-like [Penaeus japonicus]|uniref:mucin-5AC-like n=1 Tax=Penaeus japonicus TaxID=27405 RepID=UPI001C711B31|nr:mucin-5AC-like [Penaeus japonicus]
MTLLLNMGGVTVPVMTCIAILLLSSSVSGEQDLPSDVVFEAVKLLKDLSTEGTFTKKEEGRRIVKDGRASPSHPPSQTSGWKGNGVSPPTPKTNLKVVGVRVDASSNSIPMERLLGADTSRREKALQRASFEGISERMDVADPDVQKVSTEVRSGRRGRVRVVTLRRPLSVSEVREDPPIDFTSLNQNNVDTFGGFGKRLTPLKSSGLKPLALAEADNKDSAAPAINVVPSSTSTSTSTRTRNQRPNVAVTTEGPRVVTTTRAPSRGRFRPTRLPTRSRTRPTTSAPVTPTPEGPPATTFRPSITTTLSGLLTSTGSATTTKQPHVTLPSKPRVGASRGTARPHQHIATTSRPFSPQRVRPGASTASPNPQEVDDVSAEEEEIFNVLKEVQRITAPRRPTNPSTGLNRVPSPSPTPPPSNRPLSSAGGLRPARPPHSQSLTPVAFNSLRPSPVIPESAVSSSDTKDPQNLPPSTFRPPLGSTFTKFSFGQANFTVLSRPTASPQSPTPPRTSLITLSPGTSFATSPRPLINSSRPTVTSPSSFVSSPRPSITTPNTFISSPRPSITSTSAFVSSPRPAVTSPNSFISSPRPFITSPTAFVSSPRPSVTSPTSFLSSLRPSVTSSNPFVSSPRPSVTSSNPFVSSPRPSVSSLTPFISSPRPSVTVSNPFDSSPRPAVPSPTSFASSPKPSITSPFFSSSRPSITSPNSFVTSPRPLIISPNTLVTSPRPFVTSTQLQVTSPNSFVTSQRPSVTSSNPSPFISSQSPHVTPSSSNSFFTTSRPLTSSSQFGTPATAFGSSSFGTTSGLGSSSPFGTSPRPFVTTSSPFFKTSTTFPLSPLVSTRQPVITTPQPIVTSPRSAVASARPVFASRRPVVTTFRPNAAPKTSSPSSQPLSARPATVVPLNPKQGSSISNHPDGRFTSHNTSKTPFRGFSFQSFRPGSSSSNAFQLGALEESLGNELTKLLPSSLPPRRPSQVSFSPAPSTASTPLSTFQQTAFPSDFGSVIPSQPTFSSPFPPPAPTTPRFAVTPSPSQITFDPPSPTTFSPRPFPSPQPSLRPPPSHFESSRPLPGSQAISTERPNLPSFTFTAPDTFNFLRVSPQGEFSTQSSGTTQPEPTTFRGPFLQFFTPGFSSTPPPFQRTSNGQSFNSPAVFTSSRPTTITSFQHGRASPTPTLRSFVPTTSPGSPRTFRSTTTLPPFLAAFSSPSDDSEKLQNRAPENTLPSSPIIETGGFVPMKITKGKVDDQPFKPSEILTPPPPLPSSFGNREPSTSFTPDLTTPQPPSTTSRPIATSPTSQPSATRKSSLHTTPRTLFNTARPPQTITGSNFFLDSFRSATPPSATGTTVLPRTTRRPRTTLQPQIHSLSSPITTIRPNAISISPNPRKNHSFDKIQNNEPRKQLFSSTPRQQTIKPKLTTAPLLSPTSAGGTKNTNSKGLKFSAPLTGKSFIFVRNGQSEYRVVWA